MHEADVDRQFERFAHTGDPRALGAVYDALAPALLRVAMHLARDAAEAEDLLQATFVTAIERAAAWERGTRVEPWLVGILGNHARNAGRSGARAPDARRLAGAADVDLGETPLDAARRVELDEALERALSSLPEAFRPVLVLRLRHGLTTPEIAAALGRPPGTVRTQLARGLETVRRLLPASLAGTFAVLAARPARGLDAIRELVLGRAAELAPVVVGASSLIGVLAMKKIVAVVLVAALAATGWIWFQDGAEDERTAPAADTASVAPALLEREAPTGAEPVLEHAVREAGALARSAEALPGAPATPAPANRLVIRARFADGDEPAAHVLLLVRRTVPGPWPLDDVDLATDAEGRAELVGQPAGSVFVSAVQGGSVHGVLPRKGELALDLVIPRGVDVEGRVTDAQGAGVAGARVWLSDRAHQQAGRIVATADAKGEFRLRHVEGQRWIAAKSAGFALSCLHAVRGAPGDVARVTVVLDRTGARLAGRVEDAAGRPVTNALVMAGEEGAPLTRILESGLSTLAGAPQTARTDQQGEYAIDGVPLGACRVQARAPGQAPASTETVVTERGARADLVLAPAARLFGRVEDAAGAPLASVELRFGLPGRFASAVTHSGSDGSYELAGLPPGEITVAVRTPDQRSFEARLRLAPGEERAWNPRFDARATAPGIRGVVVDERGAPLAGLSVAAVTLDGGEPDSSTSLPTDATGAFSMKALPERSYRVLVHAQGEWSLFPRAHVDRVRAGDEPLRLVVEDAERTRGRIVGAIADAEGAPVADAQVILWHEVMQYWHEARPTGPEARIAVELVPPGGVTIEVRSETHPWLKVGRREVRAGETLDLGTLRLDPAGSVRGSIAGVADELLAGVALVVCDEGGQWKGTARIAEREYRSSALAPGRYTLLVSGAGVADHKRSFELAAGRVTRLDIVLAAAGTRRVVCAIPAGEDAPEWITFFAMDPAGRQVCIRSVRSAGQARVEALISIPPGSYTLLAMGPEGARSELPFTQIGTGHEGDLQVPLPVVSTATVTR